MEVAGGRLDLSQHRLRHLHMLGHADLAVHGDGFGEQLAGLVAVTRLGAVQEHASVPAADFWLLDLMGQLVGLAQGRLVVFLRLVPLTSGGRRDAGIFLSI